MRMMNIALLSLFVIGVSACSKWNNFNLIGSVVSKTDANADGQTQTAATGLPAAEIKTAAESTEVIVGQTIAGKSAQSVEVRPKNPAMNSTSDQDQGVPLPVRKAALDRKMQLPRVAPESVAMGTKKPVRKIKQAAIAKPRTATVLQMTGADSPVKTVGSIKATVKNENRTKTVRGTKAGALAVKPVEKIAAIASPSRPVQKEFLLFSGKNSSVFQVKNEQQDDVMRVPGGVRISSTNPKPQSTGVTLAARIKLPDGLERSFHGRKIRVTARVFPDPLNPSGEFAMAYSTNAIGNSGWKKFVLPVDGGEFSLDYTIRNIPQKFGGDYVGIWADVSAQGRSVIVQEVKIALVE